MSQNNTNKLSCPQCKTEGTVNSQFITFGNNLQCKSCGIVKPIGDFNSAMNMFGDLFGDGLGSDMFGDMFGGKK